LGLGGDNPIEPYLKEMAIAEEPASQEAEVKPKEPPLRSSIMLRKTGPERAIFSGLFLLY
jgi:hypothetical protein